MALQFHKTPIVLSARTLKNLVFRYKEYTSRTDFTVIDEENYEKCRSTIALLQSGLRLIKSGREKLEQLHAEIREEYKNCKTKSERKDLAAEIEEIEAESGLNTAVAESEDLSFMLAARLDEARCAMNRMNVKLGYITQKAQIESIQTENDEVQVVQNEDGTSTESGENSVSAAPISEQNQQENLRKSSCRSIKPPQASLPKFYGNAEDFPEFWAIFETLVHKSSELDVMEKILLLKESLQGRAQNTIKGIKLIPDNYDWVIRTLQDNYCNEPVNRSQIIQKLISMRPATNSADNCSAVIDQIQVLINQMISAGYDVRKTFDPMWCETILAKFPQDVVKPVLLSGQTQPNQTVEDLVGHLKKEIAAKLYIENRLGHAIENKPSHTNEGRYGQGIKNKVNTPREKYFTRPQSGNDCVFCHKDNHASMACRTVADQSSRRKILKEENRCWKCLSSSHNSYDCDEPDCSNCGQKHHRALCFSTSNQMRDQIRIDKRRPWNRERQTPSPTNSNRWESFNQRNRENRSNGRDPDTMNALTCTENKGQRSSESEHTRSQLILMTAEGSIWNYRSKNYEKVLFFFDTGAQKTIIQESVAERLGTPRYTTEICTMSGVGGHIEKFKSHVVRAKISTAFGEELELNFQTKPVIANGFPSVNLTPSDIVFLKENNICLANSKTRGEHQIPQVLVGLDYFHELVESYASGLKTPSGLHISKTVFGPTVFGKGLLTDENRKNNICYELSAITEQHEKAPHRVDQPRKSIRSCMDVAEVAVTSLIPKGNRPNGKMTGIITTGDCRAIPPKILMTNHKVIQRSRKTACPLEIRRTKQKLIRAPENRAHDCSLDCSLFHPKGSTVGNSPEFFTFGQDSVKSTHLGQHGQSTPLVEFVTS